MTCVFIGIESPDESSLTECHKTQNTGRDIIAAIRKIQHFGIYVQTGFIIGFDNDKPGVFDQMISLIQERGVVTAMVGLLNAPRGTKLYKKLMSENRLTKLPTGDNMDCPMNVIPRMDMYVLLNGYHKVLNTIYSQKYYCRRIKTFLENYNFKDTALPKVRYSGIKALLISMWKIGCWKRGILLPDIDIMVSQKAAKSAAGCSFFDFWISLSKNIESDSTSNEHT